MLKRNIIVSIVVVFAGLAGASFVAVSQANAQNIKGNMCGGADLSLQSQDCNGKACEERDKDGKCKKYVDETAEKGLNDLITQIVNIISTIVGIIAVIMIIFGGFKYITSGGDSGKISSAKTTIIYAIVGLIIVALAQAIVRFVLNKV